MGDVIDASSDDEAPPEYITCLIHAARERQQISRGQLARQLGVTPSSISQWQNGRHKCKYAIQVLLGVMAGMREIPHLKKTKATTDE